MKSILLHKHFEKKYSKLPKKIKDAFKERRNLFLKDMYNPILGTHTLHGKYKGYQSFNVTGDIRVVYKEVQEEIFLFVDIGTHPELYS
ncbi:MAG: type II toxin-antitoxin system mRNA interferase toxin, RelE/StbE family [bacterium]|nr:type II toxin-antitoxin system mRNA interferase toxin, RelE/StbE family [bacterium]